MRLGVNLTITQDALPNLSTFKGNAKPLLDAIILNTKSYEYLHCVHDTTVSLTLPNYTRQLFVEEGSCNADIIRVDLFSPCVLLRFISIADNSLQASPSLVLSSLPRLTRVVVGNQCFCPSDMKNGSFKIHDCPRLASVTVGENSFTWVNTLLLSQLDSFASLDVGATSFQSCLTFTVIHCKNLSMIVFPNQSFPKLMTVDIAGKCVSIH